MTPQSTYVECLEPMDYGYPLYAPTIQVMLGDVGLIRSRFPSFQTLYNIGNPPGGEGSPAPVVLSYNHPEREIWDGIHAKRNSGKGTNLNVAHSSSSPGVMRFEFNNVQSGDSVLIPGSVVVRESLAEQLSLEQYMNTYKKWIKKHYKKEDFTDADLILVVGTIKTDNWAIAVNSNADTNANISFNVPGAANLNVWGQWSSGAAISRCGPPLEGDLKRNVNVDQTLFISRIACRGTLRTKYKTSTPILSVAKNPLRALRLGSDGDD